MKSSLCLPLLAVAVQAVQAVSVFDVTENPAHTVTYNPGQDCLPYDGSVVPECSQYIDPTTKWPYYHEHSANCSRFWECGPAGETCLFECAPCGGPSVGLCNGQWALTFDTRYQYPDGPVCDWPGMIDCDTGCPTGSECCQNTDCAQCAEGFCNLDWSCTYPGVCECTADSDCAHSGGVCNVPGPHEPESCAFCNNGQCVGGCADLGSASANCPATHPTCSSGHTCGCSASPECEMYDGVCDMTGPSDPYTGNCYYCDAGQAQCVAGCGGMGSNGNCPDNYECNLTSHECELTVCKEDSYCAGFDQICNDQYDNCFFCGAGCGSADGCCPGCHDDGLNCAYPQPICDQTTNTCGCKDDTDCNSADFCNTDSNTCEPMCVAASECSGFNETCNAMYDNCFFCGGACGSVDGCCPGCHDDDLNCAYPQPICDLTTNTCGCKDDTDCNSADFCSAEGTCEPKCAVDSECSGFDETCNPMYDNCFFCGGDCGDSFGCCPGCHDDDLNCAYPQPICHTNTNTCGCKDDNDCDMTDFCNPDTDTCEAIPNECETDADCNEGLSGVCEVGVPEQTQCNYCTHEGHRNVCRPGCVHDSSSQDIPRCPAANPVCNIDTHICQANSGSILLTKMVFTSTGCEGCTTEGVNMTLTGTMFQSPSPQCKTVDLDYPNRVDFKDSATFFSIAAEENFGWRNCWNGPLDGQVSAVTIVWTGQGQWSPASICYDWDKTTQVVSVCNFAAGTTLAYGQSATGTCSVGGTSCV